MEVHEIAIAVFVGIISAYLLPRRRLIYLICKTLHRDLLGAYRFVRVSVLLWWWERKRMTVAKVFSRQAAANPEKIAFVFEDKEWTYRELEEYSNRVGWYFRGTPISRSKSVGLILENRPEYVAIWLGLLKYGMIGTLINTNLRRDVLLHSIKASDCKAVIFGSNFKDAINEIRVKLYDVYLYQWSESHDVPCLEGALHFNCEIEKTRSDPLLELDIGWPSDKVICIYTSGTTGLPKPAVIDNLRFMLMSCGVNSMLDLKPTDRIYNALPLYHTAGGVIGVGQALLKGIPVVLRRKFSASNFWTDCIHYECTVAQYIGEICRYLLTAPPAACDTTHKVRLMFGNGLRPQIWKPFVERFGVKQIGEFYGATEGNSNLVNIDNKIGAVGFVPLYAGSLYPVGLIRVCEETGEPIRGPDGLCIRCIPGEPGIFVGKINPKRVMNTFLGYYTDKKASNQKILRNVFKQGDQFFNTGDILVMDELGYFYFKDRTGDTFRWHGENVATSEVEAVISNVISLKAAAVYGVGVPGTEGKAGMAAIYDPDNSVNIKELSEGLKKSLPMYARPLFVRILSELPMTGTFKLKKKDLQLDGFDIKKITDPIYFLDQDSSVYVKLTEEIYDKIHQGKARL
ncbi:long-chain fatty acid transport protein 4 [Ceratina calcarata]|uniref:Very long-chain fatty acid transport protein n=1 Tax=Ceratina calcarata TaxID=156304 RepID=A0AAJ7N5L7_9HYME|nr:long-chain fatty acid transport protein 4 [Ceratina calcarata]